MVRSKLLAVVLTLGMIGAVATPTFAQNAGGGGGGGGGRGNGGGGGGGPRMTPEEFRAAQAKRTQEALGVTDAEWAVLAPKVEKVQTLQFQSMAGRFGGGRGGRGGGPGGGGPGGAAAAPTTPVSEATAALQTLLENKDATPEQIKAKLTALRDARAKAKEELTKAQAELREVLSVRQEAILVERGLLD